MTEYEAREAISTVDGLEITGRPPGRLMKFLKALEIADKALEEIQQYRAIGTVEECREAMEKQIPKRPTLCKSDEQTTRYTADYRCPKCKKMFTGTGIADYCYHCGQRLDWEELA